jgi:hypothetical protein
LLLDSGSLQSDAAHKFDDTVRRATSQLEALDDGLSHLQREREGVEERLAAARDRDRREAAAAECERKAKVIEQCLSNLAAAARVTADTATIVANLIDTKELGLGLGDYPLPAEVLSNATLAAALRRASPYFAQCVNNGVASLALSLQSDPRIRGRELHDYLLLPEERERLPSLDIALPGLLRQRAAELRAGIQDATTDKDQPSAIAPANGGNYAEPGDGQ